MVIAMRRRELLSGLSVATMGAVAGCLDLGPMEGCMSTLTVRFVPLSGADIAELEAVTIDTLNDNPVLKKLISRTLNGEAVEFETITGVPLREFTYFEEDERFYRFVEESVETGEVAGPTYTISRDGETGDVSEDELLSFTDLPRHDQWRVSEALQFTQGGALLFNFSETIVAGYLDSQDQEESMLAGGVNHNYIDFYGSYVKIEQGEEDTASVNRIRQSAELVADSMDRFTDHILQQKGIELIDVDQEVAELIEKTKANRSRSLVIETCDISGAKNKEYEDTFYDLEHEIEEAREAAGDPTPIVENDLSNEYYVRYKGEPHRVTLTDQT